MLFIIYINNLANLLPESETIARFADDVSILSTREGRGDQGGAGGGRYCGGVEHGLLEIRPYMSQAW